MRSAQQIFAGELFVVGADLDTVCLAAFTVPDATSVSAKIAYLTIAIMCTVIFISYPIGGKTLASSVPFYLS